MISSFALTLALLFQGGPLHADLHPANADVYFELGDLTATLPALEGAPLVRFLRDESLAPLFEQLGHSPKRPLKEVVQELITTALPEAKAESWFPGLGTISVSITALGEATDDRDNVAMQAVADLATPEQAQALHAALVAKAPAHEPYPGGAPGAVLLKMGDKAADNLWSVVSDKRVVVGNTRNAPADFTARAGKAGSGLASHEVFKKQLASLQPSGGTQMLWFALTRPLAEIAKTAQGDAEDAGFAALEKLPSDLNPFSSARVARTQLVGERFVTEMVSAAVPGEAAGKPVDAKWLEPVPSGSMIVYATAFDGAAAGKRIRELLSADEQSTAALAAMEQKLGFGPERVLARLGPGLTAYSSPLAGIGLPDMRVWIDCADPAAFTADFEALVGALGEALPGYSVKTRPYKVKIPNSEERLEVPVTTLNLPPEMQMPMISLAPSFAPVGGRLVFAVSSMDVKNELKRVHSGEGEPIVAGAKPLAARGFEVPEGVSSVFVMDWAMLFGSLIATTQAMAPMMGDSMPFDLKMLPAPELFAKYFRPTFHFAKPMAGGVYRRNEGSFGPETWAAIFGAAGAAGIRAQQGGIGGEMQEPPTVIEVPPEDGGDGR